MAPSMGSQRVSFSNQVAKLLECQLQYQFLKVSLGALVAESLGHTRYELILTSWHL